MDSVRKTVQEAMDYEIRKIGSHDEGWPAANDMNMTDREKSMGD